MNSAAKYKTAVTNQNRIVLFVIFLFLTQRHGSDSTHNGPSESECSEGKPISRHTLWVVVWNRLLGSEFLSVLSWSCRWLFMPSGFRGEGMAVDQIGPKCSLALCCPIILITNPNRRSFLIMAVHIWLLIWFDIMAANI